MNPQKEIYGVKGVLHLFTKKEEKGVAKITQFTFESSKDPLFNLRAVRDSGRMFQMYDGDYVRLSVNGQLMMSDTGMERISNVDFITKANGKVLVAGLGIGMIILNILDKKDVSEVIVIEKYQDVIDLVEPKISHPKLKIICADIFEYKTNEKFDTIYFDIWPEITVDNLEEIKLLHNRFKSKVNRSNPNHFMNSWMKEFLQKRKRQDRY